MTMTFYRTLIPGNRKKKGPINYRRPVTSGRLLARNTVWNLAGQSLPLIVALFALPIVIKGLGTERYGILSLLWMIIGYFTFFEMGLGRALTKFVAEGSGKDDAGVSQIFWTAIIMMLALGLTGALVLFFFSPLIVSHIFRIPDFLRTEALHSSYLMVLSIPLLVSISGFIGVLEARQRFDITSVMRVAMGVFTFAAPLAVLPFTQNLVYVIAVLVAGIFLGWLIYMLLCFKVIPSLRKRIALDRSQVKSLIHFGGWLTVSNVISPMMVYLDRFLIGALISMAAVAYYTAPYEAVTRLWVISGALAGVVFPAFAASFKNNPDRAAKIYMRSIKYTFLVMFPIILFVVAFAREALDVWLGAEFSYQSTRVLQWLAIGVFINSIGRIPYALIQGAGRTDITAKIHLLELPLYLATIWILLAQMGIVGAAVAWVLRAALDSTLLFILARRLLKKRLPLYRYIPAIMVVSGSLLTLAVMQSGVLVKTMLLLVIFATFTIFVWIRILAPDEKSLVRNVYRQPLSLIRG